MPTYLFETIPPPMSNDNSDAEFVSHHTMKASELADLHGLKGENEQGLEMFAGRPVINRETFPIEGKVDTRTWVAGGEAIVVDSIKDPAGFNKLRDAFGTEQRWKPRDERSVLESIYSAVSKSMDYDPAFVDGVSADVAAQSPDHRKVSLGWFLEDGKGVCRHMALAASWLGGEAYQQGLLDGALTAEVNQRNHTNGADAHEWARYTSAEGQVYIIDPAQKFFGTLDKASKTAQWEYFRPGEKQKLLSEQAGKQIVDHEVNFEPKSREQQSLPLELQNKYDHFQTGSHQLMSILRDENKMINHTDVQTKTLRGAVQTLFTLGGNLIQEVVDTKGFYASQTVAPLIDAMAEDLGVERDYPQTLTANSQMVQAWIDKVFLAAAKKYANEDDNFAFIGRFGPHINHLLSQLVGN